MSSLRRINIGVKCSVNGVTSCCEERTSRPWIEFTFSFIGIPQHVEHRSGGRGPLTYESSG